MNEIQTQKLPLKGMRALVTGGAQGIGAGICLELASAGAAVAVVDCQVNKAQYLANKIVERGGRAIAVSADIASEEGCRQAVRATIDEFGGLDILVNCAAPNRNKTMLGKLMDVDWETHQKIVLNAIVVLADAASDYLAVSGNGAIVNISSVTSSSIGVGQCSWPYHVSKAGLDHLTRWLAVSFGARSVRVNAIAPGLVDRDTGPKLSDELEHRTVIKEVVPLGRAGNAQDIGEAVVFLCSKQSSYITGQVLTIDGGLGLNEVFSASLKTLKSSG
jgi:glucose 1-dehydrogenase